VLQLPSFLHREMLRKRGKKKGQRWQDEAALNGISRDFKGKKCAVKDYVDTLHRNRPLTQKAFNNLL